MTNPDHTLIGVLVDRSGSMTSMAKEMDQALKTFLNEQAKAPGRCQVSLAHFDNQYEEVYSFTEIAEVPEFHISPRNATALNDALGKFITDIGEKLAARSEGERPGKVIICVITDGYENASQKWTGDAVRDLIAQQKDKYSWDFVFLGADIDAVALAGSYGIDRGSALTFTHDSAPVAMAATTNYVLASRAGGQSVSFSEDDRVRAVRKPAKK